MKVVFALLRWGPSLRAKRNNPGAAAAHAATTARAAGKAFSFASLTPGLLRFARNDASRLALSVLLLGSPAAADEAFIPNQSGDDLSIIDLASMKEAARLPLGGKPAGVALSQDGAKAYVTSPEGHYVSVIDAAARKLEKRIAVSGAPLGVSVAPNGRRIYVADMYGRDLIEIDPQSEAMRRVEVGAAPAGALATPDGRFVLVTVRDDNQLAIVDAASFTIAARVRVGEHPFGLTFEPASGRAFVSNVLSDDVSVVDVARQKLVGAAKVGKHPYGVALAHGRGFAANQYAESVSVFDGKSLAPVSTIKAGDYPEGLCASRDGAVIYLTNWFSNELWAIDAETYKVLGKAETGDGPRAFGDFVRPAP